MTMESCKLLTSVLAQKVRNRDGVREVAVSHEENNGLNRNNEVVSKSVFKVRLLPHQSDDLGRRNFHEFFWKEARQLSLSPEIVSIVIDNEEGIIWNPPA